MKVLSILGARPQFIKAAPVDKALRAVGIEHFILHTGQHYDQEMSQVFFDEMGLAEPDINLGIGSGTHAAQTGRMLIGIEEVLLRESPDVCLVYGDTNSTLAGALASAKLNITTAHIEAGLRSYNRSMPEEINRVIADHCADILFCPTSSSVSNLSHEGITEGVHMVGDVMLDALLSLYPIAESHSHILEDLDLSIGSYILATIHRPYNTDDPSRLAAILDAFEQLKKPVILPLHPRTRRRLTEFGLDGKFPDRGALRLIQPVGYLDMLRLSAAADYIITDSGGLQKEAYLLGVPCLTVRPETEWVETVESGWNQLVPPESSKIVQAAGNCRRDLERLPYYGDGEASHKIATILKEL